MNVNGSEARSVFLLYTRHHSGKAMLLGPAFTEREPCEAAMEERRSKGWDATWVEIGLDDPDFGGWIAETKGNRLLKVPWA
jgi:hypothetical protein